MVFGELPDVRPPGPIFSLRRQCLHSRYGGDLMAKRARTSKGLAAGGKRRRPGGLFSTVGSALSQGLEKFARAMATADDLDALDLLRAQHRAVDRLFRDIQLAKGTRKADSFRELADMLAAHATIEEWIFYPGVRSSETEDLLAESTEEHLAMKRTLADMLDEDVDGEVFDAKLSVLQEQVHHHAMQEEEAKLFPKVRAATDDDYRAALAGEMIALMVELQEKGAPRKAVRGETDEAAPL
jgi:hemerythrin superfamily protein